MKPWIDTRIVAVALLASVAAVAASAQNADPIATRQALMKSNGGAISPIVHMMRGDAPYNADAAAAAMHKIADNAAAISALFPTGSTSDKSKALPIIWQANDEFVGWAKRMGDHATAAAAAAPQGIDAFKAAFGQISSDCNGCHEKFRAAGR